MTRTNWLILGFWGFIGFMLIWQFLDYNSHIDKVAEEHPVQTQFFYFHTNSAPVHASKMQGPNIVQASYWTEPGKPSTGMFTSHIVLKNLGLTKAIDIQILVRPYRGIVMGDADNGRTTSGLIPLNDNDPLSQYGQWASFPDLAPGESATETIVFMAQSGTRLGDNPNPQIIFSADKGNK